MVYQIALTNYIFDSENENAIYFQSEAERADYFNLSTLFDNAKNVNVSWNNLLDVTAVYKSSDNILDTLNKNYAIIKNIDDNTYLFYHIQNIQYDSGGTSGLTQVTLQLKLDVLTTYVAGDGINNLKSCIISRAHINRYYPYSGGGLMNYTTNSRFLQSESGDKRKYLKKREQLFLKVDSTANSRINQWLNDNVRAWVYVYLKSGNINVSNSTNTSTDSVPIHNIGYTDGLFNSYIYGCCAVMCYPLYRDGNKVIKFSDSFNDLTNAKVYSNDNYLRELNNNTSNYYNIKISIVPPIPYGSLIDGTNYDVIDDDLIIKATYNQYNFNIGFGSFVYGFFTKSTSILYIGYQDCSNHYPTNTYNLSSDFNIKFYQTKEAIKNISYENDFNPVLLTGDFDKIILSDSAGGRFEYNTYDLIYPATTAQIIDFKYFEPLTPDITKGYLYRTQNNEFFSEYTKDSYTGLVISNDMSIPYDNDQLSAFLSQNKNFYLQRAIKFAFSGLTNIKNPIGLMTTGANLVDFALEQDNLKSRPNDISNSNGNAIFNLFSSDVNCGLFIEHWTAYDLEKNKQNQYNRLYGYLVNQVDEPYKYIKIRKFWNYLRCELTTIDMNLNETIKNRIIELFNRGIRFFNVQENGEITDPNNVSAQFSNYEVIFDE